MTLLKMSFFYYYCIIGACDGNADWDFSAIIIIFANRVAFIAIASRGGACGMAQMIFKHKK